MTAGKSRQDHRASKISETKGTRTRHERQKADPDAGDVSDPAEVWKDSETTPEAEETDAVRGQRGRVADRGDIGDGQVSPYSNETQADSVAGQTKRGDRPGGGVEPAKRKRR